MHDGARGRPRLAAGGRCLNWVVSNQPRSSKPGVCKGCHEFFVEGEPRVCPRSDRRQYRWIHCECICGGLRPGMIFEPDKASDSVSAASITALVPREVQMSVSSSSMSPPGTNTEPGIEPPTLDTFAVMQLVQAVIIA